MRFLKEMIARSAPDGQGEAAPQEAALDPFEAVVAARQNQTGDPEEAAAEAMRAAFRADVDSIPPLDRVMSRQVDVAPEGPDASETLEDRNETSGEEDTGASVYYDEVDLQAFDDRSPREDEGFSLDQNAPESPHAMERVTEQTPEQVPERVISEKIWDIYDDESAAVELEEYQAEPAKNASQNEMAREAMEMLKARAQPTPESNQPGNGRVKTRLLGFNSSASEDSNVFAQKPKADAPSPNAFPVGWMVVVDGPGRGTTFPMSGGVSQIGRGEDQAIRLNFGDSAISRSNHAVVAYDDEQNAFFVGHGGKANIVRLNGQPVLSTEELSTADQIRIGETTLRFVALCDDSFCWEGPQEGQAQVV